MNFCNQCGESLSISIPAGDNRERHVCTVCSTIHYQNPTIITGCIPAHENSVLLCRRAISPRQGFWTLPAGFLEEGETIAEGAARETFEEANARITLNGLYGIYDVVHIGQIYMFYRASLNDLNFFPGAESLETQLFTEEELPWNELAFPVIHVALTHFFNDNHNGQFDLKTTKIDRSFWSLVAS